MVLALFAPTSPCPLQHLQYLLTVDIFLTATAQQSSKLDSEPALTAPPCPSPATPVGAAGFLPYAELEGLKLNFDLLVVALACEVGCFQVGDRFFYKLLGGRRHAHLLGAASTEIDQLRTPGVSACNVLWEALALCRFGCLLEYANVRYDEFANPLLGNTPPPAIVVRVAIVHAVSNAPNLGEEPMGGGAADEAEADRTSVDLMDQRGRERRAIREGVHFADAILCGPV
eukprot:CAMPEP_0181254730 /NCGR_PEP_ID=MMETSP1096-20121128/48766_1 /TAXON_ID=156174 ORGANISM="Chrysochromulina ericina, Strain CCMP281" /NCGR_SAMPLE_ID=MMETSP1096 /ASSEMBLY_ACC=CAM_ASM_000453 /LENGTH=228 /DNA_ID=CAMNT_0023352799 /DNA_START=234 /DNA_END=923 /DNA_ORIENTATION=-